MNKLSNKVAIVTGASKGIGAGIAKALAAEGASVVVNYSSSKEGADRVVKDMPEKAAKQSRYKAMCPKRPMCSASSPKRRKRTAGWTYW
jgi:3-oxoacyl-[acyl-carrier protein] reductase